MTIVDAIRAVLEGVPGGLCTGTTYLRKPG